MIWKLSVDGPGQVSDKIRVIRAIRMASALGLREALDLFEKLNSGQAVYISVWDEMLVDPRYEVATVFSKNNIRINKFDETEEVTILSSRRRLIV